MSADYFYCDEPLSESDAANGNVCTDCVDKTCTICGEWLNSDGHCEYCLEDSK